ncbi:MAG: hypothetical protein GC189_03060 [Alphaproteobacteria bacterium]|nr:hypothetical protein [Alphaproteobacteria bacterium]
MMRRIGFVALMLAAVIMAPQSSAQDVAGARVALVIANSAYDAVPSLDNPPRDAARVAEALARAGFEVERRDDVTIGQFGAALRDFKRRADQADVALIYFAGHGIELEDQNWLIPTDARLADPADALVEAVSLSDMLRFVGGARRLRIIILDACRDNPFALRLASPTRTIVRGLRPVENLPAGTLVAFSASSGQQALDGGAGAVSPFAAAFAERVTEPGLEVSFIFRAVRDDVLQASGSRQQRPWLGMELGAERIVFVPDRVVSDRAAEVAAFEAATRAWTAASWRAFLQRWPEGVYAAAAQNALTRLEGRGAPSADPIAEAEAAIASVTDADWRAADSPAIVTKVMAGASREGVERLSGLGDARAQWVIGAAYLYGLAGFARDDVRAARLFQAAALSGDARAQASLGHLVMEGIGGFTADITEAERLLRLSADAGNALGQSNLGSIFLRKGPQYNEAEALRLYRLSAAQGNPVGQSNLGAMYAQGLGGLEADLTEAARLFSLSAAQGSALGQYNLAGMHLRGAGGVAVDRDEALRLLDLAAAQGFSQAQEALQRLGPEASRPLNRSRAF